MKYGNEGHSLRTSDSEVFVRGYVCGTIFNAIHEIEMRESNETNPCQVKGVYGKEGEGVTVVDRLLATNSASVKSICI